MPNHVWRAGALVARGGEIEPGAVPPAGERAPIPELLRDTVNVGPLPPAEALVLGLAPGTRVRAVGVRSQSLTTAAREVVLGEDDVAHAAVVGRHHATGRIGRGYATGFGLRRGALAEVALPLAGLMSDMPAGEVAAALDALGAVARAGSERPWSSHSCSCRSSRCRSSPTCA